MSSDTLTNLQIVSRTVDSASKETRKKYQYALDMGVLSCPTAKVMFLGDKGVGKTSAKNLLLGKEFEYEEHNSPLIQNHVTETKTVSEDWKEVTEDYLAPYQNSEFTRAIAYFCAFEPVNYMTTRRQRVLRVILKICIFLLVIFFLCCISAWLRSTDNLGYSSLLISSCLALALATQDFVNGCTIGHGLAAVIAFGQFFVTVSPTVFLSLSNASRLVILGLIGAVCGYSFGALLALGIGTGVSICLSMLRSGQQAAEFSPAAMGLFTFAILVALLMESKPVQRLHNLVKWAVVPLVFIVSVLLLRVAVDDVIYAAHYLAGFFFGVTFIAGQKHGRKLAWKVGLGHKNRVLTVVIGVFFGFLLGYTLLGWGLPLKDRQLIYGGFGVLFSICGELYRYYVRVTDPLPARLITKMKNDNDKDWPTKLHLLDCKSTEVYNNAHHIFMSRHCIYLVLFPLDKLRDNFNLTYERILFWMNSVFTHARHQDAKVFLVATHKAAIRDDRQRAQLLNLLHEKIYRPYGHRLVMNEHKESLVFAVENVVREINDGDVNELKRIIFDTATRAEYTTNPNRVTWFKFWDIIRARKERIRAKPKEAIVRCNDLWKELQKPCHLNAESDFYRMLKYFHDTGEIYYDENDPMLCRLVVFDPQFLINAVDHLLNNRTMLKEHSRMQMLREDYTKRGLISHDTLKQCLRDFMDEDDNLLRLLVSLNVLLPVDGRVQHTVYDRYVVPFLLPYSRKEDKIMRTPDCILAFDFGCFYPEPVFLVLLSKCLSLSFRTTEEYNLVITEKNLRFYRDQGSFYFADAIHFSVHLCKPRNDGNMIWVRVKALESSHHQGDLYEFLHQLDVLMRRIRWRYFEFLEYKYKVLCDCCLDKCEDMNDPPNEELDWHTVVDHSMTAQSNISCFPDRDKSYICREDKIFRFKGNPKEPDVNDYKDPDLLRNVVENFSFDAFVSCDAEDRMFVLQDLLPILENASTLSFGDGHQEECLNLIVNEYDNPSPDYQTDASSFISNVMKMQSSHCIIAVISKSYLRTMRCKKELQIAKKLEKPIIPVIIDPESSVPALLSEVNPICYPEEKERLREDFYVKIIRSVKQHAGRIRQPRFNLLDHLLHGLRLKPLPPPDLVL